jgi:sugar phosphate permease
MVKEPAWVMLKKEKIFWGWYIVAGTFLVMAVNYGTRYCFGVFVKPLSGEHGWSRSVISLAATINMLVYSIGAIFVGRMLDRIAPL